MNLASASVAPTGSARQAIPIEVPQGTGGQTPTLALVYSSENRGPSWVGKGWSLEASRIQRSLKHGVPDYSANEFVLDGQDLIEDDVTTDLYHTRRESFLRIHHDPASDRWEVFSQDGSVSRYGLDTSSRIDNGTETFAWLLAEQEDLHGNVIQYGYDDQTDPGHRYLSEVRYTLRRAAGGGIESLNGTAGGDDTIDRVVKFELQPRPDPVLSYRAGFESRISKRLSAVDVRVAGQRVRRYELGYQDSPDSFASMLTTVSAYGVDGDPENTGRTPPLVHSFTYQYSRDPSPSVDRTGWGSTDPDLDPGDPSAHASYWDLPYDLYFIDEGIGNQDTGTRLADLNGDGFVDAIREYRFSWATTANHYPSGAHLNGRWGFFDTLPPGEPPREDPATSSHRLPISANDGDQLHFARYRPPNPNWVVEPMGTQLADFNGDGKADVLQLLTGRYTDGSLDGWPFFQHEYHVRDEAEPGGWRLVKAGFNPLGTLAEDVTEFVGAREFGFAYHAGEWDDSPDSIEDDHAISGPIAVAEINGDSRLDLVAQGVELVSTGDTSGTIRRESHGLALHRREGDGFEPASSGRAVGCMQGEAEAECGNRVDLGAVAYQRFGYTQDPNTFYQYVHGYDRSGRFADVNGDGLDDRVIARKFEDPPGSWGDADEYRGVYLNVGGRFEQAANPSWELPYGCQGTPPTPCVFLDVVGYNAGGTGYLIRDEGYRLTDLNGDGRVDIVRAAGGVREVWLGTGVAGSPWQYLDPGDKWQIPAGLDFVDANGRDNGVRLADLNGDGMVDLVRYILDPQGFEGYELQLNQGAVPDLLIEVRGPLGGRTSYQYGPSTQYDNTGDDAVPDLAQVMQVVTQVTIDDNNGNVGVNTFSYSGGFYDSEDREFRGFAEVTAARGLDGQQTITRYHQDDARAGLIESMEVRDSAGQLWSRTEYEYTPDATAPYVSQLEFQTLLEYDGQAQPRRSRREFRYDAYGNLQAAIDYGEVDSTNADVDPLDTRTAELAYNPNDAPGSSIYLVNLVKTSRLLQGLPGSTNVVRQTEFFYDGDTTGAMPPNPGNLTRVTRVLDEVGRPDPTTTFGGYDAYGNVGTFTTARRNAGELGGGEGTTSIQYETTFFTFPASIETVVEGVTHRTELGYADSAGACSAAHPDAAVQPPGAGRVHEVRGPNDLALGPGSFRLSCYDVFGREVVDRGPQNLDESTWTYADWDPASPTSPATVAISTKVKSSGEARSATASLDGFGRTFKIQSDGPQTAGGVPQTIVETFDFDEAGRLASRSAPHFAGGASQDASFEYDPLDRVVKVTLPAAGSVQRETTIGYVKGQETIIDPNSNVTARHRDVFGQITEVIEPDGSASDRTRYAFDVAGRLVQVIDRDGDLEIDGNVTSVTYDQLGRRRSLTDPDTGLTTFDYDPDGNLTYRADAAGETFLEYDALGRIRTRSYEGQTDVWSYDTASNGVGYLASRTDESGTLAVAGYDLLGRPLHHRHTLAGRSLHFQNTFDPLGQLESRTFPTGRTIGWSRDARGYLTAIQDQGTGGVAYASGIIWDARGRLERWTGNGVETQSTYQSDTGRLEWIDIRQGGGSLEKFGFEFDDGDRIEKITTASSLPDFDFIYDALDRLYEASGPYDEGFALATLQYEYDEIGNLLCKAAADRTNCQATGGTSLVYPAAGAARPHAPTQVNGNPAGYTAVGDLQSLAGRVYSYDPLGRLRSVVDGGSTLAEFTYNAAGRRVTSVDHTGPRPSVRHYPTRDFDWDQTRRLAHTHLWLDGTRIATQVEAYPPPASGAWLEPAAPLGADWVRGLVAGPALAALLLLLLQLLRLRREGVPLLRPALAGAASILLYFWTLGPSLAWATPGDLNADARIDAADSLRLHEILRGLDPPSADELARGDVAPLEAVDGELTAGDLALLLRAVRGDDVDGDGLATRQELAVGTSPFAADTDGNGTPDGAEDADGDGLANDAEFAAGADPWAPDTDGDGLTDGADPEPAAGVVYRHGDQLGSTVLVTGAGGALLQRAVYRPFGESVPAAVGEPAETPELGFTGQRHVASVGLYDYGARFYDPALGRFLQADPVVPDPFDPQTLNRYAYVRNDPIHFTDPTGNSLQPIGGGFDFELYAFGLGVLGAILGSGTGRFPGGTPVFNSSIPGVSAPGTTPPITSNLLGGIVKGGKIILKGGDIAGELYSLYENLGILLGEESSTLERVLAGADIASSIFIGIDSKDAQRALEIIQDGRKATRRGTFTDAQGRVRNADGTFAPVDGPTAGKPVDSATRSRILERDQNADGSFTCATCGQTTNNPANIHTGHVRARSRGGDLSDRNLRCEGAACNLSQGAGSAPKPGRTCADRGSCGAPFGRTD